jgi:hypothetical protein
MWKKISVVAGWMPIPFAALAVLTDGFTRCRHTSRSSSVWTPTIRPAWVMATTTQDELGTCRPSQPERIDGQTESRCPDSRRRHG